MTEDMVKQQADVFERLGTSEDATQMRAKLQSAQLYSGNKDSSSSSSSCACSMIDTF